MRIHLTALSSSLVVLSCAAAIASCSGDDGASVCNDATCAGGDASPDAVVGALGLAYTRLLVRNGVGKAR